MLKRCLALFFIGLLAYSLLRALWGMIQFNVYLFDWQWYIPLITLVLAFVGRLVWRWPFNRINGAICGVLVIWLALGYDGFVQTIYLRVATPPVPLSFWTSTEIFSSPDEVLTDVRSGNGALYIVTSPQMDDTTLIAGLRRLAHHDIPVYLAPGISEFLSTGVYAEWLESTTRLATLIQREQITNVLGYYGDVEPPLNVPLDFLMLDADRFWQTAANLPTEFATLHQRGIRLGATAAYPHYLDSADGDADLAVLMRSPLEADWAVVM